MVCGAWRVRALPNDAQSHCCCVWILLNTRLSKWKSATSDRRQAAFGSKDFCWWSQTGQKDDYFTKFSLYASYLKKKKKILTCEQPWIWQMIAIYSSEECSRNAFLDLFSRLLMSQESKYGSIRAHATFIYLTLEISKSTPWWVVLTLYETISSKSRATRPRWLSLIDHGMRCAVSAQCMLNFRDLA